MRVLVVDDNVDGCDVLATFIRTAGHDVRMAHDGREALEAAAAFLPDIIFLDIAMPELDGYEVCSGLRTSPRSSYVAIYAVTGFGSEQHRSRATRAGFDAHFVKPLDLAVITEVLNGVAIKQS